MTDSIEEVVSAEEDKPIIPPPYSRKEILMMEILNELENGGGGGGGSGAEEYLITVTDELSAPTYITNRTFAEIKSAYIAGKRLRLKAFIEGVYAILELQGHIVGDNEIFSFVCDAPNWKKIFTGFITSYDGVDTAICYIYVNNTSWLDTYTIYVSYDPSTQKMVAAGQSWADIRAAYDAGRHLIVEIMWPGQIEYDTRAELVCRDFDNGYVFSFAGVYPEIGSDFVYGCILLSYAGDDIKVDFYTTALTPTTPEVPQ